MFAIGKPVETAGAASPAVRLSSTSTPSAVGMRIVAPPSANAVGQLMPIRGPTVASLVESQRLASTSYSALAAGVKDRAVATRLVVVATCAMAR